jgi:hypothetical protein
MSTCRLRYLVSILFAVCILSSCWRLPPPSTWFVFDPRSMCCDISQCDVQLRGPLLNRIRFSASVLHAGTTMRWTMRLRHWPMGTTMRWTTRARYWPMGDVLGAHPPCVPLNCVQTTARLCSQTTSTIKEAANMATPTKCVDAGEADAG